jgi:hypothetical protein
MCANGSFYNIECITTILETFISSIAKKLKISKTVVIEKNCLSVHQQMKVKIPITTNALCVDASCTGNP